MKVTTDTAFTLSELEMLCGKYMECRLSRLEEVELHYILNMTPLSSEIIDHAKEMMDISLLIQSGSDTREKGKSKASVIPAKKRSSWLKICSVAASAAIILAASIIYFINRPTETPSYCQIFVNGKEIKGKDAEIIADHEMKRVQILLERINSTIDVENQKISRLLEHETSIYRKS